jgi:hypothetical protein
MPGYWVRLARLCVANAAVEATAPHSHQLNATSPTLPASNETSRAVKILAQSRPASLQRLLTSLNRSVFTDPVELHIYVDALPGGSSLAEIRLHQEVIELCASWPWRDASRGQGGKRVAIRKEWVGLKRQWLECYVPRHVNDQAVILEDDCEVSPVFWQWAEKAAGEYSSRPDLAGIGLQRQQYVATGDRSMPEIENNNLPYLYRMPGFWGYRPSPSVWYKFLQWYSDHQDSPYIC